MNNKLSLLLIQTYFMKFIAFFLSFFIFQSTRSQDIINLLDGNEIYSKVLKITDLEVEYKKYSNIDGPSYTKKLSEVSNIKYKNGSTDYFQNQGGSESTSKKKKYIKVSPPEIDGTRLAEVDRINGMDIYFMSQPLLEYEIVGYAGNFVSDINLKNIWKLSGTNLKSRMSMLSQAVFEKAQEMNEVVNGLVYSDGTSVLVIRYLKDSQNKVNLAKVDTLYGHELYILSKPYMKTYDITNTEEFKSGEVVSLFSLGLISRPMIDDIEVLVKYIRSQKKNSNAVLYREGKSGSGIKWR